MVLKKSNSKFNSGVTQRLTNRGAIFEHHRDVPLPEHLTIFIKGHDDLSNRNLSTFETVLETIYEFLDWQGPNLSSFYDEDGFPRIQNVFNTFDFAKNQKRGSKPMSERLRELTTAGILEDFSRDIEIEISIKRLQIHKHLRPSTTLFSWKSTSKAEERMSCEGNKSNRKRFHNQHHRGLQRRQMISKQGSIPENDKIAEPQRKITLIFQESHQVDVRLTERVSPYCNSKACYPMTTSKRALFKNKSFVNGLRSSFKGYNFQSMKEDLKEAVLDDEDKKYYFDDCFGDDDFQSDEEVLTLNDDIVLLDCVKPLHKPSLQKDTKNRKETNSNLTPVNSASSEKVIWHPKGSYILINESNKSLFRMIDTDSGFVSKCSDTADSLKDDLSEPDFSQNGSSRTQRVQLNLISNIDNFISRFISVEMSLPVKLETQIKVCSPSNDIYHDKKYSIHDCQVHFGNCYPPSFIVKLKPEVTEYNQDYYLIAKAFNVCNAEAWSWQLQIGQATTCNPDPNVTKTFLNIIERTTNTTLEDVVEAFQGSVKSSKIICHKQNENSKKTQSLSLSSFSKGSTWQRMEDIIPSHRTVSFEKAIGFSRPKDFPIWSSNNSNIGSKITLRDEQDLINMSTNKTFKLEDYATAYCDVCFLPCDFSTGGKSQALALIQCGHTFCLNCWSSHVFIGLSAGHSITCMNLECKQALNESVMRTLVPGHLVSKWHRQNLEKEIEKNPKCKWCPNTLCDKVAVIEKCSDSISQFGGLVSCDCHVPWCFSCQRDPHWPASCDQMAAFCKILAKTGNDFKVPLNRIEFTVEVKRCPRCHYPIEKNHGCPSMVCRMCWYNFCWNCLRPVDHTVYTCKPRSDNFTTFHLQNKLVYDFPLKFFANYLKMAKKKKWLHTQAVRSWLESLSLHGSNGRRQIRIPFYHSLQIQSSDVESMKKYAFRISKSSLDFSKEVFTFLEPLYVLLCFVKMSKEMSSKEISTVVNKCLLFAERLRFICWRIEEKILFKNMSQIFKEAKTVEFMLKYGRKQMITLCNSMHSLQKLSRNVDPTPWSKLDPKHYIRYM